MYGFKLIINLWNFLTNVLIQTLNLKLGKKFWNWIKSIYTTIRSTRLIYQLKLKKRIIGLDLSMVVPIRPHIRLNMLWDEKIFPDPKYIYDWNIKFAHNRNAHTVLHDNTVLFFFQNMCLTPELVTNKTLYLLGVRLVRLHLFIYNMTIKTFGDAFFYAQGMFTVFFVDSIITDDEPIWEPVEWSLLQTWILFIFAFAWIAENLISSRYGSYTGRDKRVWNGWYKTFWLIEAYYIITLGLASIFVITPFYHEINYSLPLVVSWWNWYNRVFFFKFISLYSLILYLAYYIQFNIRWMNWKKLLILVLFINMFLGYLLYTHFVMSFFSYFTDPNWYHTSRLIDYVRISHEPNKWSWGNAKRDHFSYHKSSTVFWFKNDGPFAASLMFFHFSFLLFLFFLYFYWVTLARRIYASRETTITFTTYCVTSLKQFYFLFFALYLLVLFSFMLTYLRFPIEYYWLLNNNSWVNNALIIILDYPIFLKSIIF